jgi:hypothetical protein
VTDTLLNPIEELRALAGVAAETDEFDVVVDGVKMHVHYIGGSSRWVRLSVPYDMLAQPGRANTATGYRDPSVTKVQAIRPMSIKLTAEGKTHIEGKETGGDVEHQTGDKRFDDLVYIDAPSTDPLAPIFAIEEVRKAVLDLFAVKFDQIEIDDAKNELHATCSSFDTPTIESHSHGSRGAKAFVRLAKSLPQIQAKAGWHQPESSLGTTGAILSGVAILMLVASGPAYFGGIARPYCTEDGPIFPCLLPGIVGCVVAVLLTIIVSTIAKPILRQKHGGTSSSSRHINAFIGGLGAIVFFTTLLFVSFLVVAAQQH